MLVCVVCVTEVACGGPDQDSGNTIGSGATQVSVRPLSLEPVHLPAKPEFDDGRPTQRLLLWWRNTGSAPVTIRSSTVEVLDQTGQSIETNTIAQAATGELPNDVRLLPGAQVLGYELIAAAPGEVPATLKVALLGSGSIRVPLGGLPSTPPRRTGPAQWPPAPPPGTSRNLSGTTVGEAGQSDVAQRIQVELGAPVDPAQPDNDADTPDDGTRLVAFPVTLTNTGDVPFTELVDNDVLGFDDDAHVVPAVANTSTVGPEVPSPVPPGATVRGFVVVEVPEQARLNQVQFALGDGPASSIAQWAVG
jgi:archaellum component FlaG (FlaF/FlaG flagellin family)